MSTISTQGKNTSLDSLLLTLSAGKLQIGTTAMGTVLASLTLGSPAFTSATNTSASMIGTTSGSIVNTGTAAAARLVTSTDAVIISEMTVGTSNSDINLNSVSLVSGGNITINSLSVVLS